MSGPTADKHRNRRSRSNNKVQAFTLDGKFLKEGYVRRESEGTGSTFGVALSRDPQQRFVYVADGSNDRIAILQRDSLEVIGQIGRPGRRAGEFFHIHGESQGYRVQRFLFKGCQLTALSEALGAPAS